MYSSLQTEYKKIQYLDSLQDMITVYFISVAE